MRQVLAIAAILAMYGLIAYSMGIPLPPQPWLSLIGLAVLETVLLVYNQPVAERLVGEVLKPGYTPRQNELDRTVQISRFQRAYVILVMLCSTCSITAVLCCQTGVWATPDDMQLFALLFIDGLQMVGVLIIAAVSAGQIEDQEKLLGYALATSELRETAESDAVETANPNTDLEAGPNSKLMA